MIKVRDWDAQMLGALDLEAVRALYQPVHRFRVQQSRHEAHTPFLSGGVARTYYVLSGKMEISDGASTYALGAGQYMALPEGRYTITYPEIVEHVSVLALPEQVWAHEKELYATTFRPRLQTIDHRMTAQSAVQKKEIDDV